MRHILTDLGGNPIYTSYGSWRTNHHQHHRHHHRHGNHPHLHSRVRAHAAAAAAAAAAVVNPRSPLFLHVAASSWDEAVARAASHPAEVLEVDEQGNTPLHRACQRDPPAAVVLALSQAASAAAAGNGMGLTPLHVAASHRCNAAALAALVDADPSALRRVSHYGRRTPLHYACASYRGLDLAAFQILLDRTLEESRRVVQRQQRDHHRRLGRTAEEEEEEGRGPLLTEGREDTAEGMGQEEADGGDLGGGRRPHRAWEIADFIDILCDERDGGGGDAIDDEEVSVVVVNEMSRQYQQRVAAAAAAAADGSNNRKASSSSGVMMMDDADSTAAMDEDCRLEDDEEEEDDDFDDDDDDDVLDDPNQNVSNVVTWKDSSGHTPLGLLFRRYRERVRSVIAVLEQMRLAAAAAGGGAGGAAAVVPAPPGHTSLQTDLGHLWGKARLIVARLTEEQRDLHGAAATAAAIEAARNEPSDDDSSAHGEHWTAAAAWSKERFGRPNIRGGGGGYGGALSALAAAGTAWTDGDSSEDDGVGGSTGNEEDAPPPPPPSQEERQFRIVHASVGLTGYGCPPEMIRLAISIHPHQVREMDEDGNLPLHIAATASSFSTLTSNIAMTDEESSVFSDSMASLFSTASSRRARGGGNSSHDGASFDRVIKLLLKQYPQAAQTPHGRSGRLPLVLAARAGHRTWNDGMKTLLRAYPPALFSGSKGMVPVKLYPHVLSLVGGCGHAPPSPSRQGLTEPSACAASAATSGSPPSSGAGGGHSRGNSINHGKHQPAASPPHGYFRYARHRFSGRGGIGMLDNLLLLKQRHMRESMAGATAPIGNNGTAPPSTPPRRQRNHLQRDYHSSAMPSGGSGHGSLHRSRPHWSSLNHRHNPAGSSSSSNSNSNVLVVNNNLIHAKRSARKGDTDEKLTGATKVDPKLATTMFELLRTKPDLVEAGRSYQAELKRASGYHRKVGASFLSQEQKAQKQPHPPPPLCARKKTMSRKLLERMTVFERKARKPST